MQRSELISSRLEKIKKQLGKASLVAVSKYTDLESIRHAHSFGQRDFGENKVQDLKDKCSQLPEDIRWHFMGNIQTNKINNLLKVPGLSYIHSIDSLKTLEAIFQKEDQFIGESLNLFLQVKTSDESEKAGFSDYKNLAQAADFIFKQSSSKFKFYGLMTMGKMRTENFEEDARICFNSLLDAKKRLEEDFNLGPLKLSMGMSQDFHIALELGSDYVRLGTSIFSEQ